MNKLLIIAYHFPPDASIGAVRSAEFVLHLPEFGWEPVVLTVKDKYHQSLDRERYGDLQNGRIYRTDMLPSPNDLLLALKKRIGRKKDAKAESKKEWFDDKSAAEKTVESLKKKIRRCYNSLIYLPDNIQGWIPFAFFRGLAIHRQKPVKAIFTTGPPQSAHIVGLLMKIFTRKTWIVDFRDPWEVENKPKRSRTAFSDRIDRLLERLTVKHADAVVCVSPKMTERLHAHYPAYGDKFKTIYNGYNSDSLEAYSGLRKYDKFTLTYAGSLYFGRNPYALLKAISQLKEQGLFSGRNFQMLFIGDCRYSDDKSVENMVAQLDIEDLVVFRDRVPQSEALQEAARADSVLLIAPNQPLQIPAKVFEYVGLNKFILAMTGEGATRDLLSDYPLCDVVEADDCRAIEAALKNMFSNRCPDDSATVSQSSGFDRRTLTEQLVGLISYEN